MDTFLPNGTIVRLAGGDKRLMIYGRKQFVTSGDQEESSGVIYDYLGVPYPEGFINQEHTYIFNDDDIIEVVHEGFKDEEEDQFQEILRQV